MQFRPSHWRGSKTVWRLWHGRNGCGGDQTASVVAPGARTRQTTCAAAWWRVPRLVRLLRLLRPGRWRRRAPRAGEAVLVPREVSDHALRALRGELGPVVLEVVGVAHRPGGPGWSRSECMQQTRLTGWVTRRSRARRSADSPQNSMRHARAGRAAPAAAQRAGVGRSQNDKNDQLKEACPARVNHPEEETKLKLSQRRPRTGPSTESGGAQCNQLKSTKARRSSFFAELACALILFHSFLQFDGANPCHLFLSATKIFHYSYCLKPMPHLAEPGPGLRLPPVPACVSSPSSSP